MSRECPRSVRDTFLTLRGHSRDTFWTLQSPGPFGPRRHPLGHPRLSGTLSGTLRDTSGPKGLRDSCSRPGCSQGQPSIVRTPFSAMPWRSPKLDSQRCQTSMIKLAHITCDSRLLSSQRCGHSIVWRVPNPSLANPW